MMILKLKLIQTVHKKTVKQRREREKEKKEEKRKKQREKEKENCGLNTHERHEFSSLFDEESTFRVFPSATFFFLSLFVSHSGNK